MTTTPPPDRSAPTDDIVARLRAYALDPEMADDDLSVCREAADEIERLRDRIAAYLTDTIPNPVERHRVAAGRFGKAVALELRKHPR